MLIKIFTPNEDYRRKMKTTELEKWLLFLMGDQQTKEELAMESRMMKEAYDEFERPSQSPKTRELAEYRERELKDIRQREFDALEDGLEQGREQGVSSEKKRRDREIVVNMYVKDFSVEDVIEVTGVPLEKVNEIIKSIEQ